MRALILGPGAVGTVLAVRLAASGVPVTVRPRATDRPPTYPPLFRVDGVDPAEAAVDVRSGPILPGEADAAVVATKGFDLAEAAARLAPLGPVPVLLVQNGLGVRETASEGLRGAGAPPPHPFLVPAVQSVPATWLGPGVARQAGRGEVLLAADPPAAERPATDGWAGWLAGAGVPVRRVPDLPREIWRKLLVNAAINPVTADHGIENGRLADDPWRGQALALLEEARSVAARAGYDFPAADAEAELFRVVRATAANRSSMLQDLDRHRPTEIESISGAVLALGVGHGLPMTATRRAVERIRRRAAGAPGKS